MTETSESSPAPRLVRSIAGALASTALDFALLAIAMGGIMAVLSHERAVWLLVIYALGAMGLAILRPVRRHDPVELDKESPLLMLALLLFPLLAPPIAAYGERFGIWMIPGGRALHLAGLVLVGLGFALRIAAISRLGSRFSPFVAVQGDHALVTSGVYARLRHPGYLGAWLAAVGAALVFGSALGILPALGLLAALRPRIRREEALLERHFGDTYREYKRKSGGMIPRLW